MSNNTITREIPANVTQRILEMRHLIFQTLEKEGFRPEENKFEIAFQYEKRSYVLFFDEHDCGMLGIEHHVISFPAEKEAEVLLITNDVNCRHKFSRVFTLQNNNIWARTVLQVNTASDIVNDFWDAFNMVIGTCREFVELYRNQAPILN